MNAEAKNESGKTFIDNEKVIWEFNDQNIVEIPINQIKLIAEYTTENGPFMDDWFLVIYNNQSEYFEISMYAEGIQEMMDELGELLEFKLFGRLVTSAEWVSNILYPIEFNGKELWNIVKVKPKSVFDKLKSLIGINKTKLKLTEITKKIIEPSQK